MAFGFLLPGTPLVVLPAGPGSAGLNGWTPILAVVSDADRRVLQVVDWTGGTGTKPTTGLYIGATGLEADIADGVNIRGEQGAGGGGGGSSPIIRSVTKTDTQSTTAGTWVDVIGLSIAITPASAASKFLVRGSINFANNANSTQIRLVRDSTPLAIGDAAGSRSRAGGFVYDTQAIAINNSVMETLDEPASASLITYKVQFANLQGAGVAYINRSDTDNDVIYVSRVASTLTVIEIP